MGSEAAAALDQLVIPQSRIKAIAKQEKDVAGLTQDALEAVGDATKALLKELVEGAASTARCRTKSTKGGRPGSVTIEPHDIREHILGTGRLSFLRNLAEQSKDSGFLEGYRSRAKAHGGGRKRKGVLAQVAGLGDLGDSDDEGFIEEDADVAAPPESARASSSAPLKLDEDYDDEDDGDDEG